MTEGNSRSISSWVYPSSGRLCASINTSSLVVFKEYMVLPSGDKHDKDLVKIRDDDGRAVEGLGTILSLTFGDEVNSDSITNRGMISVMRDELWVKRLGREKERRRLSHAHLGMV
jgi:hypothetical protein